MKVIFIKDVGGVGRKDTVKEVAEGYALNFLIPGGYAVQATGERLTKLKTKIDTQKRAAEEKHTEALKGIERLRGASVRLLVRANDAGGLYQEIQPVQISTIIQSSFGVKVPADTIFIVDPIKKVGHHTVQVKSGTLSADVRVEIVKNGK